MNLHERIERIERILMVEARMTVEWTRADDARFAAEVMGLVPCDKWHGASLGSAGGFVAMLDAGACEHEKGRCYPTIWPGCRTWLTAPDAAIMLQVIEAMREKGWHYQIEDRGILTMSGDPTVSFWREDRPIGVTDRTGVVNAEVSADMLPRAVVEAAAKAYGIERGGSGE